jgi:hypothetical protein
MPVRIEQNGRAVDWDFLRRPTLDNLVGVNLRVSTIFVAEGQKYLAFVRATCNSPSRRLRLSLRNQGGSFPTEMGMVCTPDLLVLFDIGRASAQ